MKYVRQTPGIALALGLFCLIPVTGAMAEEAAKQGEGEPEAVPEGRPAVRLESVFVGDKEQPAVSYFIPWQGTRTPDKLQWNLEKKHDATLSPVDRDVLERTVKVYQEMNLENE